MATMMREYDARLRPLTNALEDALNDLGAKNSHWTKDGTGVTATLNKSIMDRGDNIAVKVVKGKVAVISEFATWGRDCSVFGMLSKRLERDCEHVLDGIDYWLEENRCASR